MDATPNSPSAAGQDALEAGIEASPGTSPDVRRRRRVAVALAALLVVAASLVAVDQLTSSPALCGSCHEMGPRTEQWRQSGHAEVKCVSCHLGAHTWYQYPKAVAARAALLGRDLTAHFTDAKQAVIDERLQGVPPMSQDVCLQCHDVNRKATSGFRILIDHPKHAKRNGSCVSCHVRTAHPKPTRGKALSLMGQCFTCHGTAAKPRASAACKVCHPADFQLQPASHRTGEWKGQHGRVARTDPKQCEMCHARKWCDSCHGMPMPHPKGWAQRTGHPVAAERQRAVCDRCHGGKADWCTMCHHKAFDPAKGTWAKQHFLDVERRGASFCLDCHSPTYCSRCHVRGGGSST